MNFTDYIKKVYEQEEKYTTPVQTEDCVHDTITEDGAVICMKCGEVLEIVLTIESYDYMNNNMHSVYKGKYNKLKHFTDTLHRLSGYFYNNKNNETVDIELLPTSMKGIRKYIKKNKLHIKNDYYYWRQKNNVTVCIDKNHEALWKKEYLHTKKSLREFLYDKLIQYKKYEIFYPFFKRKIHLL